MNKRIFIALTISDDFKNKILGLKNKFANLPIRWLEERNFHITLIPPFYEEDEGIGEIKEKLKQFKNAIGEIDLHFESADFGSDRKNPRLIWITGRAPKQVNALKEKLEEIFRRKSEYENFLMHVTVARFNPDDFHGFPIKKLGEKISWRGKVGSLVLMESKLSKFGSDYEILERVKL